MPSLNNDITVAIRTLADTLGLDQTTRKLTEMDLAQAKTSESSNLLGMSAKAGWAAVGIAVAAGVAISVKAAGDYQQLVTKLATSAGESVGNLKLVSDGMLQVARDTGTGTTELADAMYKVESGGQHGADGLLVLKAAAQGAKAEQSDLTTVADAVTSVLVDYHLKAQDAADVTSKLVAATAAGKMSFQDLAAAMPAVLPVASAAHVSLNDILGDMASMTVHGMSAQQSAQNLTDVIRHMQAPTAVQGKELALLSMTTTQLADDLKNKGLSGTLQEISTRIQNLSPPGTDRVILDLKTALNSLPQSVKDLGLQLFNGTMSLKEYNIAASALDPVAASQAKSFETLAASTHKIGNEQMSGFQVMQNYGQALAAATGDATGLKVALMLTGENAAVTNGAIKSIAGSSADASGNVKGWTEIQGNFNQQMAEFGQYINTASITIGTALLPGLTAIVGGLIDVFKWFGDVGKKIGDQISEVVQKMQPAINWIAQNVMPVLQKIGDFVVGQFRQNLIDFGKAWGQIYEQIKPIMPQLAMLAAAMTLFAFGPLIALITAVTAVMLIVTRLIAIIAQAEAAFARFVTSVVNAAQAFQRDVVNAVNAVITWFSDLPRNLGEALGHMVGMLIQFGMSAVQWAKTDIPKFVNSVVAYVNALPGEFGKTMSNVVNTVVNWFNNLPKSTSKSVDNAIKSIVNAFNALPGELLSIGEQMMNGLMKGINNTSGKVISTAKSFVGGFIDGIKNQLGIHSPSTVFLEIGSNVVAGLTNGIDGSQSAIRNSSDGMVNALTGGFGGVGTSSYTSGANGIMNSAIAGVNGGGNTYNFTGPIMLGDSSAVDAFFKKIDQDSLLAGKGMTLNRGTP